LAKVRETGQRLESLEEPDISLGAKRANFRSNAKSPVAANLCARESGDWTVLRAFTEKAKSIEN
jgi:hypothetical protein